MDPFAENPQPSKIYSFTLEANIDFLYFAATSWIFFPMHNFHRFPVVEQLRPSCAIDSS